MTKKEFEQNQKAFDSELRDIMLQLKEMLRDEITQSGLEISQHAVTPSADPANLEKISNNLEYFLQQVGGLRHRVRMNAKEFYQF